MLNPQRRPAISGNHKTWILVANRSGARLFASEGVTKNLRLLENVDHPEGRLKGRDLETDRSGSARAEGGADFPVHGLVNKGAAVEHVRRLFAKSLGSKLNRGRAENSFAHLILVAEPKLLGEIRAQLDPQTQNRVDKTFEKDLANLAETALGNRLEELLLYHGSPN